MEEVESLEEYETASYLEEITRELEIIEKDINLQSQKQSHLEKV